MRTNNFCVSRTKAKKGRKLDLVLRRKLIKLKVEKSATTSKRQRKSRKYKEGRKEGREGGREGGGL